MLAPQWTDEFERGLPRELRDAAGPTITRMIDLRRRSGRRHLVQDAALPDAVGGLLARLVGFGRSGHRLVDGGSTLGESLVMLTMGYDTSLGQLVERDGRVDVRWPGSGRDPVQLSARATATALAAAAGSSLTVNPRLGGGNSGTPITVHPLGGAPMGSGVGDGVVDDVGRLFHPAGGIVDGCYIADASVIPTSVGANPSLTIAALAERAVESMIAGDLSRLLDRTVAASSVTAGRGACS